MDIDGTLLKHRNNVQIGQSQDSGKAGTVDDGESLLPAVNEFLDGIPETDQIVLTTARKAEHREITEKALERFGIMKKVDSIVYDINSGPRILINDIKPAGSEDNPNDEEVQTAYAINVERDGGLRHLVNDVVAR